MRQTHAANTRQPIKKFFIRNPLKITETVSVCVFIIHEFLQYLTNTLRTNPIFLKYFLRRRRAGLHINASPSLFTITAARLFAFRFSAIHASPLFTRRRAYFSRRAAPFFTLFSPAAPPRRRGGASKLAAPTAKHRPVSFDLLRTVIFGGIIFTKEKLWRPKKHPQTRLNRQ